MLDTSRELPTSIQHPASSSIEVTHEPKETFEKDTIYDLPDGRTVLASRLGAR